MHEEITSPPKRKQRGEWVVPALSGDFKHVKVGSTEGGKQRTFRDRCSDEEKAVNAEKD